MSKFHDKLITRDTRGSIRYIDISCDWSDDLHAYVIDRKTGLLGKKITQQPFIEIKRGKAQRTVTEQATLQYNSEVKKYLDKGYKRIQDLGISELTLDAAENALPSENTDQNGVLKPQLCKILDKTNNKLTNKFWLASYKHDGLRMFLFWRDGGVHTASRGGQDYDVAATYIREDPFIVKLLSNNPNLILDGELYVHGEDWNLQRISGLGRKQELEEDHKYLTFHCYDIVDMQTPFKFRAKKLGEIQKECPKDSKLVIVDHFPVTGLDQIMKLHDKAVAEGYEGLVIRDPEKEYKCGARDNRMLKIKEMEEDSFLITGYELGLRGIEDMCFTLETKDGKPFKAKPQGDRALKEQYMEEIDDIIGRMGDVKFFHYTPDGIPNLPVFLNVRYDI